MATKYRFLIFGLWSALVVVYFFAKAPVSMRSDWTHDDLMNCYRAFETPYSKIFTDLALFWKPSNLFRPLGELLYKIGFDLTGFNIWPWRAVISAILILNAFILGHVAMRLSGSFAFGLATIAIASYHTLWTHLYLNTGTIFEIFAFTFVYLGLAVYVEFRAKPWVLVPTALIFLLGLNAKESAIVLPVYLVLYDLLWHKRIDWKLCGLFGAISIAFILGRVYGPQGISSIGSYKPVYSLSVYLARFQGYFGPLILWKQAPLWAALPIAFSPLLLRSRMAVFATLVFPIGILPLAFVPDRGLEGVYIACAGLALAIPCVLLLIPRETWRLAGAAVIFFAVASWMPANLDMRGWDKEFFEIRTFHENLKTLAPNLPRDVQIRFVKEPFPPDMTWASVFATALVYRDKSIRVAGEFNPHTKDWPATADFATFEWRDNKLVRLK